MAQDKPKKTIVRAADGTLWAVTKDGTVKPLDDKETKKVEEIVARGDRRRQNWKQSSKKRCSKSRQVAPKGSISQYQTWTYDRITNAGRRPIRSLSQWVEVWATNTQSFARRDAPIAKR